MNFTDSGDILEESLRHEIEVQAREYLKANTTHTEAEMSFMVKELQEKMMKCVDISLEKDMLSTLSDEMKNCYSYVKKEITKSISASSSDIYGGFTGNLLFNGTYHTALRQRENGAYWSYWVEIDAGLLDLNPLKDGSYWKDETGKQIREFQYTEKVGVEFFAEYMAAQMTRDTRQMNGLQAYKDFSFGDTNVIEYVKSLLESMKK